MELLVLFGTFTFLLIIGTPVARLSLVISSFDKRSSTMTSERSELPCAATSTVCPRSTRGRISVL